MIQIILTREQQRLIDNSTEPVEIVDLNGRVLTSFETGVSEEELSVAQCIAASFDDVPGAEHGLSTASLARIDAESRHFRPAAESTRELLDRLKSQNSVEATR